MKSFFPSLGNNKNLWEDGEISGLRMNRRSLNKRDNIQGKPQASYYLPYRMVMVPVPYNGAQYYGGYGGMQYPVYPAANTYQNQQQDFAKRLNIPPSFGQPVSTPVVKKSETLPTEADDGNQVSDLYNGDADGFYDAISNTKEAFITKGLNGRLKLVETIMGNSNVPGIAATKKSQVKSKISRHQYQQDFKKTADSKGELETNLLSYFTNYICGNDC